MKSIMCSNFCRMIILICSTSNHFKFVDGLASVQERVSQNQSSSKTINQERPYSIGSDRRFFVKSSLAILSSLPIFVANEPSMARYILNDDGDYEEIEDEAWQAVWKQRLDKASSMSKDEIFSAARGAGNINLKDGEESEASRKRRAMSNCRNGEIRKSVGLKDEKQCTARVMSGDYDFILSQSVTNKD